MAAETGGARQPLQCEADFRLSVYTQVIEYVRLHITRLMVRPQ
jgi:hypothetical protein